MDDHKKTKKRTIKVRYWQAGTLIIVLMLLMVGAFYFGIIVGKIQEGEDRIVRLKERERADASREEMPLSFYEDLEKNGPVGNLIQVPPREASSQKNGEKATSKVKQEQNDTTPQGQAPETVSSGSLPVVFMQVASFRQQAKADSVAKAMKKRGYPARVKGADLKNKGMWYRVELGPFSSNEEMQATISRIKQEDPKLLNGTSQ